METKLLEQFDRFKDRTAEPVSAAILTLAWSMASAPQNRTGLTIQEAADYLGVSARTVSTLHKEGQLKCSRIGRLVRFNADDLEAFQRRKPAAEPVHPDSQLRHLQRRKQTCS